MAEYRKRPELTPEALRSEVNGLTPEQVADHGRRLLSRGPRRAAEGRALLYVASLMATHGYATVGLLSYAVARGDIVLSDEDRAAAAMAGVDLAPIQ